MAYKLFFISVAYILRTILRAKFHLKEVVPNYLIDSIKEENDFS